jgi:hypothetical protein
MKNMVALYHGKSAWLYTPISSIFQIYCEDQFLIVEEIRNTEKQNPLTDQKIKPTALVY